jgi:DNA primase
VVNQIAETIAKVNKAEDFTKQQDYIRQCSQLLRIDETGLNALVNKFIRERVGKAENRQQQAATEQQEFPIQDDFGEAGSPEDDSFQLLFKDELHERAVVRSLVEFGLKEWEGGKRVADYFFEELVEEDLFDNKQLLQIIHTYKNWYDEAAEPTAKMFLYHPDQQLSTLMVSIMDFPYELSEKWKTEFEMPVPSREDVYREEVRSTLNYLKLRKIKRLMAQNQQDLEKPHTSEEQLMLIQTHQHLKLMERELLQLAGTVYVR